MDETLLSPLVADGRINGIRFSLATPQEICTSSISDCPVTHPSQLTNPFLGLPLESGKCESCGTAEPGQCEGHFGFIQLPVPVYHPCHVSELKRVLSSLCLNCLKMKKRKVKDIRESDKPSNAPCTYCPDFPQLSIKEKKKDDAFYLELMVPHRSMLRAGFWDFLDRYGYHYGDNFRRSLLPSEALEILKRIPEETRTKLAGKGHFSQHGYILQYLPVPPNCLSVPDISDGISIMSTDLSVSMLKKVLKEVETIRSSRSGAPNFESHEIEANGLQLAIGQYLHFRGSSKASRDMNTRLGISKETNNSSTKEWLEKMRTLFIRKGSGFSSRSVITGDAYKGIDEIGLPLEIAQRITFEEKVSIHNMEHLQKLVDDKLCLTYRDGVSTYSLREGSKGYTSLQVGQVVHRRIMDGDIIFINRPPSTHKHSLQAFSVYVHNDHTVKINPLICGPFGADFDGDCVHLFYPQSLAAKAEVLELFTVEKQLCSSHSGNLNLQLVNDSLLSLKLMFKKYFFDKAAAQQLAMFVPNGFPEPALQKACRSGPLWTALQILQTVFPTCFDCSGERHLICRSELLKVDFNRDVLQSLFNEVISSVFFQKGSKAAVKLFNSVQPLLMENIFSVGFSVGLKDFFIPKVDSEVVQKCVQDMSPLLLHLRSTYNELVELQVENHLRSLKLPFVNFILKLSTLGSLIDSKSDSAVTKVVQQLGFLGMQLSDRGKFYSRTLVEDMTLFFQGKYPINGVEYSSEAFGLIKNCFFQGLNPYEELVHSISSREVLVRSSRGLTEPGTLFKNLMAILRDVVICYDGTVRDVCSNSVVQFEYGGEAVTNPNSFYPAGEPVGVLAATAISNPAYKAVLDSSPSSNSSWEMMKEILLSRVNFKNEPIDRRIILYLNDCSCGKDYCRENAACMVQNQLKRVSLKDISVDFMIEYQKQRTSSGSLERNAGVVGHIHLDKMQLKSLNRSMHEILQECLETINSFRKRKKLGYLFKMTSLTFSESCCLQQSPDEKWSEFPCLQFFFQDTSADALESNSHILANIICPVLLETIVKGDPRVYSSNVIWISPDTTTYTCKTQKGEVALEVLLEKTVVKKNGDAWRIVMDSCLPVIHLIDTRRSIPYGIKQVKELLGISCAFDQAVQRLSTSVRMVAKGVLKEHLILIANSMTCTGDLIGFNRGGYKNLFRSLNVQVPFTEATLFTPRKCFERAAEKCHVDSLSSIVASCSWGKHVAIGTGTNFEILWNNKEMGVNQDNGIDVYNFLQLVRSSNEVESSGACLGGEIDDLGLENGDMEFNLSPRCNSNFDRPIFDEAEVVCGLDENQIAHKGKSNVSNWECTSSLPVESSGFRGWNTDEHLDSENADGGNPKLNVWDSRGTDKAQTHGNWGTDKAKAQASRSTNPLVDSPRSGGWNTQNSESIDAGNPKLNVWDSWGTDKAQTEGNWGTDKGKAQACRSTNPSVDSPEPGGWNTQNSVKADAGNPKLNVWDSWGADKAQTEGNWGTDNAKAQASRSTNPSVDSPRSGGWNTQNPEDTDAGNPKLNVWDSWGTDKAQTQGNWGTDKAKAQASHSTNPLVDSPRSGGWNTLEAIHLEPSNDSGKWDEGPHMSGTNKNESQTQLGQQRESPVWGTTVAEKPLSETVSLRGWGSQNAGEWTTNEPNAQGRESIEFPIKSDSLDAKQEHATQLDISHGWCSRSPSSGEWDKNEAHRGQQRESPGSSQVWGTTVVQEQIKPTSSLRWGSDAGDWKKMKNRPSKPPGRFDDRNDWNASGVFTASRQRLDLFTFEEQNILSDVEPIMQTIKRIMHQNRYKDGEPLSAEDQSFVLDNVFTHHPDKESKMGDGVDYVMVNKHSSFQDSRCFYVVSTDGRSEDFSYRKCIENFIKGKYPAIAESFISKYFKKPRSVVHVERE
ncbi:DNA-directed RNA polymerase V subunit 1 [Macadamia integrifolia]|uniref:DNA-directed RNA polymerase V subunit 1 n=1 Tax=Macadamia integrifolia TaxID=60698 RepID=UPI001C4EA43A|nr:DNA-directed RNA polymerase V subunit 1 [Macadamia integrifolia]XP_042503792.1 DNA-directed RNA polymerase V subunit 1 [Macadamia integrifolia]